MAGRRYGTVPRDLPDNERFWHVGPNAARLYLLLCSQADDFGRWHGDPVMVRNGCYRGVEEREVTTVSVGDLLTELSDVGLIRRYRAPDAREYLEIVDHVHSGGERVERFPAPPKSERSDRPVRVAPNLFRGGGTLPASMPDRSGEIRRKSLVSDSKSHLPVPVPSPARSQPRPVPSGCARSSDTQASVNSERVGTDGRGLREAGKNGKPKRGARAAFAARCGGKMADLARNEFVEAAFRHAVELGFVPDSDGGRQTVFAAAEECLRSGQTFGLFVKFVCEPDGRSGITNEADMGAENRIRRFVRGEGSGPRVRTPIDEVFCEDGR